MKMREIYESLKKGTISIDARGHYIYSDLTGRLLEDYKNSLDGSLGVKDNGWTIRPDETRTMEQINADMREFYRRQLDRVIEPNESVCHERDLECFGCGERLGLIYENDKLVLREFWNENKVIVRGGRETKGYFDTYPVDYRCPYEKLNPFTGEIKVTSPLVFVNFFRSVEDAPEDKKYTSKWSLNNMVGRDNITKHLAKQNVAYGQMSNMSIGVFLNDARDSVIIGSRYNNDSNDVEEINGHKIIGTISLAMWRWEASDLATVQHEIEALKKEQDVIIIDEIKHGVWDFTHYNDRDEKSAIFATLKHRSMKETKNYIFGLDAKKV